MDGIMKILFVVDSLAVGGGAERITVTLGNEFYRKGHEIFYLTFFDESPKYKFKGKYYTLNQNKCHRNPLKKTIDFINNSFKIKKVCTENNINTIISIGEVANYHVVLSKLLFRNKREIIISQHINPEIHLKRILTMKMIKFFYPKADKTVCVSKDIEKILKKDFNVKNTVTIHNMLDIKENIRLSNENLPDKFKQLFSSGYNFINIGRLEKQKGQWFLIRSFRKVVDKHENAKLYILGEGNLNLDLIELIKKLNLQNNVFILGNQNNIFPLLKNCDCFVLSSLYEGFPMTLLESLSMNIPIISTDCKTGPREILCPEIELDEIIKYPYFGKNGILIKPFNRKFIFEDTDNFILNESEQMLTNLMLKMIQDSELVKRYSNGLELVKKLDKDIIVKKWEKLF